jgi:hypothetical protein
MKKIGIFAKFMLIILLIALVVFAFYAIAYKSHILFSNKWNGYSIFTEDAEKAGNVKYFTIPSIYYNKGICDENSSESIFYFTNSYKENFCNNMVEFSSPEYCSGYPLYDTEGIEKRDDFVVTDWSFKSNSGNAVFRFPLFCRWYGEDNEKAIAKTKNSTYADMNLNKEIDNRDISGEFGLVSYVDKQNVKVYLDQEKLFVNNPSMISNELITKYDNEMLANELLSMDKSINIVYEKTNPVLGVSFLLAEILPYLFNPKKIWQYFLIYVICIVSFILAIRMLISIWKTIYYYHTKSKESVFYDTVKAIYNGSKSNDYYYKWLLWTQLHSLKRILEDNFKNEIGYTAPELEAMLKSRYPALSSIDLKTLFFYLHNISKDLVIKDKKYAKALSENIDYTVSILKRGY